ncbi:hypothetical protein ACHQM5_026834 [Ranunculus cassubicifolius]
MESSHGLPFEVGQLAESKSFQYGFRGAWFRCKIKDKRMMKGKLNYSLEFFDFPGEKVTWTQLYQKGKHGGEKSYLMVRPPFPYAYCESQMSDTCTTSEVVVIVKDEYKVGDLVDWWSDGCYWSGKITHLLDQGIVKIKLHDPPAGEGKIYEAFCKDLRPSLDWSPNSGWTLPVSLKDKTCHPCARLVYSGNQDHSRSTGEQKVDSAVKEEEMKDEETKKPWTRKLLGWEDDDMEKPKPSLSDSVSRTAVSTTESLGKKKIRVSGRDYLDSAFSDTIESSILDLEELVSKIKWIKRGHQFGFDCASGMTPAWQFLES